MSSVNKSCANELKTLKVIVEEREGTKDKFVSLEKEDLKK
jgi:hypothetical protein